MEQALTARNEPSFVGDEKKRRAFSLGSSFYAGRVSGNDPLDSSLNFDNAPSKDRTAELEGEQRLYAFLINGHYDLASKHNEAMLHPYVGGGVGLAVVGGLKNGKTPASSENAMVPLLRLNGGVACKVAAQMKLSLDYAAAFSGNAAANEGLTSRDQKSIDMHTINLGLTYQF
ncbi:MAG: hypothetical protein HGA90_06015 [Alphaproteobacteria bacterium]|nr:hypothetical protein [Alphaproteobacteria bacterium]